ncbi:MAG: hypothetical protein U0794_20700 [Isosphaeraceae bacterium]
MNPDSSPPPHSGMQRAREWAGRLLLLSCAIGWTISAYRYPSNALPPTLAFFCWSYFLLKYVIEVPRELGLLPSADDRSQVDETEAAPIQQDPESDHIDSPYDGSPA